MKNWLIGLLVLCGVVFGGSALACDSCDWTRMYPEDSDTVCHTGWMEGYHYYHATWYSFDEIPDVIPPEGWMPPLLLEAYCLSPHGGWVAEYDNHGLRVYIDATRYTF